MEQHALVPPQRFGAAPLDAASYRHVPDAEVENMRVAVTPHISGLTGRTVKKAACMYVCTPDYKLLVDRVPEAAYRGGATGPANVTVVSACSGHGFKHAPSVAEGIARTVLRGLRPAAPAAPTVEWPPRFPFEAAERRGDMYAWRPEAKAKL